MNSELDDIKNDKDLWWLDDLRYAIVNIVAPIALIGIGVVGHFIGLPESVYFPCLGAGIGALKDGKKS